MSAVGSSNVNETQTAGHVVTLDRIEAILNNRKRPPRRNMTYYETHAAESAVNECLYK